MRAELELRVLYDAPAHLCGRHLLVLPLRRPDFEVRSEHLTICPPPDSQTEDADPWNNRRLRVFHRRIEREFRLELKIETRETNAPVALERLSGSLKMPSRAAPFTPELLEISRAHRAWKPSERAEILNRLVFERLEYDGRTSDHPANCGEVWKRGHGSCADFAHVLLSLGRASGLPARYVAGFGPAPGALHAYVEFAFDGAWHAFDPTHGREARGFYLPVATGRDFYDCAPHVGRFRGGSAQLEMRCALLGD